MHLRIEIACPSSPYVQEGAGMDDPQQSSLPPKNPRVLLLDVSVFASQRIPHQSSRCKKKSVAPERRTLPCSMIALLDSINSHPASTKRTVPPV